MHDYRSPHFALHPSKRYVLEYSALLRLSICFVAKLPTGSSAGERLNVQQARYVSHDQTREPSSKALRGTKLHGKRNGMRRCRAMLQGDCVRIRPRLLPPKLTLGETPLARRRFSIRSTFPLS